MSWLSIVDFDDDSQIQLDHISFEMHSVCNMRCAYCSDVYYGGIKSPYDTDALLADLAHHVSLRSDDSFLSIVFGGGEPVLFHDFPKLLDFSLKYTSDIIVFTNSTIYSADIHSALDSGRISIITSIDAGDSETFRQVRGLDAFERVLGNLAKYSSHSPSHVTIKYIFTETNSTYAQVKSFLEKIHAYNLFNCNFQISSDFKSSALSSEQVTSIKYLKQQLQEVHKSTVFLDDHLAPRLIASSDYVSDQVAGKYVVWGCGEHSKRIFERIGVRNVKYFVDRDPSVKTFMGIEVKTPDSLVSVQNPEKIFIASVYFYNAVRQQIHDIGAGHLILADPY